MTTAVAPTRINACSQLEQFFSAIGDVFGSATESTDSAFRRVQVSKRDLSGNIRSFPQAEIDPLTGQPKTISVLTYIEDVKSGDMYKDEPAYVVASKCALVAVGIPFYAFGKMVWYVVRTPIDICTIAMDAVAKVCKEPSACHSCTALGEVTIAAVRVTGTICTGVFEVVKAPLFALGCELAAIYGICKPYHGRKFEAAIEHAWLQGASYKEDLRKVPARPGENCWTAFTKDVWDAHPFYLAHCFQVRGNVNDPNIVVIGRAPL